VFLIGWSERSDKSAAKDFSVQFSLRQEKVTPSLEFTTMAKGKGKRSSGANETLADAGVSVSQPESAPEMQMPQIDEGAFAGLRQKIEQRLKDQSSGKGKSKKNDKPNASAQKIPATNDKQATPKADKKREGSAQGKKRDRNGDVIARDEKKGGKNKQDRPAAAGVKKDNSNDTLRQEILALGGTEEDLELLADVDSESEVEGTSTKSKVKGGDDDLRKELSKMLEAAGHVVPEDLAEDEVEEEGEEVEEEAEAEDDDLEEEEAQDEDSEGDIEETSEPEDDVSEASDIEEAPPAPKEIKKKEPEVVIPKEFAKLVCQALLLASFAIHTNLDTLRPFYLVPIGMPFPCLRSAVQSK
jgi:ribosome biogenesis protein MAK21